MNTTIGFQAVLDHFRRNKWAFQANEAHLTLFSAFRISNGTIHCAVALNASDDLIQVISFLPFIVPSERRLAAGELCVRLSANLNLGRFDLSYEGGEVRLLFASCYSRGELKDAVICGLINASLATVDRHFRAFTATVYGNTLPAVAALQPGGKPGISTAPTGQSPAETNSRINRN
jgi:hypothetical protein